VVGGEREGWWEEREKGENSGLKGRRGVLESPLTPNVTDAVHGSVGDPILQGGR
jgi:hypothetical protein